ncbi:MAG: 2-hydroxychromene-2-carboxylate isomerase [SAR324 cluster bacterium]|nr:2-hydroxychromene-2-carboxylate isomerase [SAR324 cluster bacterium]
MAAPGVEFFFDYASPYAYMGSLKIEEAVNRHGSQLSWKPMVLGFVFQATGFEAPMTQGKNPKSDYLLQDLQNLSEAYGAPYKPRTDFIIRSILALRATLCIPDGPERAKAVHGLFHGAWGEDLDLNQPEVVAGLLDKAGFEGAKLVERTQEPEIKHQLKANTDEAVQRGAFGAPTMFIDSGRMFWGHDRIDVLDHFLGQAAGA